MLLTMAQSAAATEPTDLSGSYEYQGNLRNATISKIEIQKLKGQHHVHVWFYGRPDDVDWGEATATEYKNVPMNRTPDLAVVMRHGDAKAIITVRVNGAVNEKINQLKVQSWVSYTHSDEKHQNEAAQDMLKSKN